MELTRRGVMALGAGVAAATLLPAFPARAAELLPHGGLRPHVDPPRRVGSDEEATVRSEFPADGSRGTPY